MKTKVTSKNIWLYLLPLLGIYIAIIIIFEPSELLGDQQRYLKYAENLTKGFYLDEKYILTSPGYPIILAPFVFFKIPLIFLRIINSLFLYLSLIIIFKTILKYSDTKIALTVTTLLGLYYPVYEMLPLVMTEVLSWFLISLICYSFIHAFKTKNISSKHIVFAAIPIAILALTRGIFGYVILTCLIFSLFILIFKNLRDIGRKASAIFLLSLLFCTPFLIYTYGLTSKVFHWSGSGGETLYLMSSPYENELGSWITHKELLKRENHQNFLKSIRHLDYLKKDEILKQKAIDNIMSHPYKFVKNWLANVGRMLFSYPHSYASQSINTFYTLIPNMFIIVFIFVALGVSLKKYKHIPEELIVLLVFIVAYLFGSSLVSAQRRMFYITLPFWSIFISYVVQNLITLKLKDINDN